MLTPRRVITTALVASFLCTSPARLRAGSGQSFTFLQEGFTQEVIGTASLFVEGPDGLLGDVAFAPGGDFWSSECRFADTRLHRYDTHDVAQLIHGSRLWPESIAPAVGAGVGGCGMTNHPDGTLYSNMDDGIHGVANLDAATGGAIRVLGPPGNALGITVDPETRHVIYVARDCRFTSSCTLIDLDPVTGSFTNFAVLLPTDADFVDGIYFDPTGSFLFLANRHHVDPSDPLDLLPKGRLTVLNRSGAVVQHIDMVDDPDGVSFHATSPRFVVTNNEGQVGNITRFDFPGDDYTLPPVQTVFADGGFRGDLTRVGADGCIYVTQRGTRYDDGTEAPENSIVRICAATGGGFAPGPGVSETVGGSPQGSIAGTVFLDVNHNGMREIGEAGLGGVPITLSTDPTHPTTSGADGTYLFSNLTTGSYAVGVPAAASGYALSTTGPITVTLPANEPRAGVDFGYAPGSLAGAVFQDLNHNGLRDTGEPALAGMTVMLGGPSSGPATSAADGSYQFTLLAAGSYTVMPPSTVNGLARDTAGPLTPTLLAGQNLGGQNFGYVSPDICYMGTDHPEVGATQRVTVDQQAGTATILTTFSRNFVDNTYGVNAIGWGSRGHTFSNLTGSDHVQLSLLDGLGATKLEFSIDFISATSLARSGYSTLCGAGGDGGMITGNASDVIGCRTSMSENFNTFGYVLTQDSPFTDANYTPNSQYPNWIFDVWYEVTVKLSAFDAAGFGRPMISGIHASPSKTGVNTEVVGPCVPDSEPPSGGSCQVSTSAVTFQKHRVKLTMTNDGSSPAALGGLSLSWPAANGRLRQIKLAGDTLWSGNMASPATINSVSLTTNVKKKSVDPRETSTLMLQFDKNVSAKLSDYSGSIQFDSGCIVSFPPP